MRYQLAGCLLLLAACTSSPTTSPSAPGAASLPAATPAPATPAPSTILPTPDTARAQAVGAQADTLASARQAHEFSRPGGAPDVFRLVLRGPSVLAGEATFTITDASGQVIFREMLSAAELEAPMQYQLKTPATLAAREAFVRRRIREFFGPAQFTRPAVPASATYPAGPDAPDRATWDDLRHRPQSIRFTYITGKLNLRNIAWSPLKKQVVRVGS